MVVKLIRLPDRMVLDTWRIESLEPHDIFVPYFGDKEHGEKDCSCDVPAPVADMARLDHIGRGCEVIYRLPSDVLGNSETNDALRKSIWEMPWLVRPLMGNARAAATLREAIDRSMGVSIVLK